MSDKQELLSEYNKEKNLDFKFLILVYLSLTIAFFIILPKIYIKNQIYYISRDMHKLNSENSILEEENIFLKQKLESIRFKNQILDSIFIELDE
ncbi:MAG: hypothetical protein JJV95_07020 [Sulfurospirillum sp.]|nr:hypothetical protein [Sulfurospirillum sp.]MBL0703715.1 hypothetical protein [Sulfurospirillum sp.]